MKKLYGEKYDQSDPDGSLLICEVHERNLLEHVSGLGDANTTMIDIGANVGLWALSLADEYARVLAIEPNPTAFKSLEANCVAHGEGKVKTFNLAAWDTEEEIKLQTFIHTGHTTAKPGWKPDLENFTGQPTGEITVKAVRIDSLEKEIIGKVGFVKVDTEGAEIEALTGMLDIIKRDHPMLLIEIHNTADAPQIVAMIPDRKWKTLAYGGSVYLFSWSNV